MGMMLPCIKFNYHAYIPLVHPILFCLNFHSSFHQEDNGQAFLVTR